MFCLMGREEFRGTMWELSEQRVGSETPGEVPEDRREGRSGPVQVPGDGRGGDERATAGL